MDLHKDRLTEKTLQAKYWPDKKGKTKDRKQQEGEIQTGFTCNIFKLRNKLKPQHVIGPKKVDTSP